MTHLLYLLRSRLLHFVNCISTYLMTRVGVCVCVRESLAVTTPTFSHQVLHGVGTELKENITMATDLEEILRLHSAFLSTIFDHCFLNKKVCECESFYIWVVSGGYFV